MQCRSRSPPRIAATLIQKKLIQHSSLYFIDLGVSFYNDIRPRGSSDIWLSSKSHTHFQNSSFLLQCFASSYKDDWSSWAGANDLAYEKSAAWNCKALCCNSALRQLCSSPNLRPLISTTLHERNLEQTTTQVTHVTKLVTRTAIHALLALDLFLSRTLSLIHALSKRTEMPHHINGVLRSNYLENEQVKAPAFDAYHPATTQK